MSPSDRLPGELLSAPAAAPVPPDELERQRRRLEAGLADAATGVADGARLEIGLSQLRRARYRPEHLGRPDEPFAWKPAFVRRSLGCAAVRACADGRFRGPAEAVGPVADAAVEEWRRTGWRTFHWEPWLAGLGAGGRAAVLAEAVTWATPLWGAFDWPVLAPVCEVGRPDDRWSPAGGGAVELRGRSEVRAVVAGRTAPGAAATDGPPDAVALVSVAGGRPGDGWPAELAFLALVAGLASPTRTVPARVVGLWPEAGALEVVEIDGDALAAAVDRVVDTVAVTVDAFDPGRVPTDV